MRADEHRSSSKSASSPEVWKRPKIHEMSTASCLLPSGVTDLKGQPIGTIYIVLMRLEAVKGQICPSTSSTITDSAGGSSGGGEEMFSECSEEAHKNQYGNKDETW